MLEGHPVVCVTPSGRRRYMALLAPHVLASPVVDRWDLWVNTTVPADLAFFEGLARTDPRVRLVRHPDGAAPCVEALGAFSRLAMDPGTVYVRLDDDVVWAEPGFFERLAAFRLAHREYFLVMPLILNNALCSNILQTFRKIVASRPVATVCLDKVGWRDPDFAVALHRFAQRTIAAGDVGRLHCGPVEIALNRFSINGISWMGEDMAASGGVVGPDEEEELSAVLPTRLRRRSCFFTDVACAHFAFYSQREVLDETDVLDGYARLAEGRPDLREATARARALLAEADALADGTDWAWPPRPRGLRARLHRLRKRWTRRKPPRVTLAPGPSF